jgi:hypothetical protein
MDHSPLLRLPPELRNQIWELVIPKKDSGYLDILGSIIWTTRPPPALIQVCKAVRHDTAPMWYGARGFYFAFDSNYLNTPARSMADWPSLRQSALPAVLQYARKVEVEASQYCASRGFSHRAVLQFDLDNSGDRLKDLWREECDHCYPWKSEEWAKKAFSRVLSGEDGVSLEMLEHLYHCLTIRDFLSFYSRRMA